MQPYEEYFNVVRLVPENFRDFKSRREIDRDQLMTVLANVTHLLIRANYNSAKMALYRYVLEGGKHFYRDTAILSLMLYTSRLM